MGGEKSWVEEGAFCSPSFPHDSCNLWQCSPLYPPGVGTSFVRVRCTTTLKRGFAILAPFPSSLSHCSFLHAVCLASSLANKLTCSCCPNTCHLYVPGCGISLQCFRREGRDFRCPHVPCEAVIVSFSLGWGGVCADGAELTSYASLLSSSIVRVPVTRVNPAKNHSAKALTKSAVGNSTPAAA
jgi:hypothetical protein